MPLTAADIPKENLFSIGRGRVRGQTFFHFANPRRPFVFSRAEALNIIGYLIAHEHLQPADIDQAVSRDAPDPFRTGSDGQRFIIVGPETPVFLVSRDEALSLIGHLVRKGMLQPSEIDAAAEAIVFGAQGQSIQDVVKLIV